MSTTQVCMVYITAGNYDEARVIGKALVEEHLAACANILENMKSLYFWENALQDDSEAVLIVKTQTRLIDKMTQRITALHSYDVPCVVALPIVGGNPEYIRWVCDETGGE
ncbi:MAG: divalent cation tolerance protein CutA [Chitinivibrionales bacterium]|nr:divalent cation tolerance protein CutA [Chitinivibrionales bacterium]